MNYDDKEMVYIPPVEKYELDLSKSILDWLIWGDKARGV